MLLSPGNKKWSVFNLSAEIGKSNSFLKVYPLYISNTILCGFFLVKVNLIVRAMRVIKTNIFLLSYK